MGAILRERFGGDPRLRFVAAEDPVSTYDLLQSASMVLPFVSTIAMEGAALSKPVLIAGRCYYSDLGFVWVAASQGEYFDLLERGLEGRLPLLPDQVEKAWGARHDSFISRSNGQFMAAVKRRAANHRRCGPRRR